MFVWIIFCPAPDYQNIKGIKKHHAKSHGVFDLNRDREGIQTPNLLIRSETLYSVELLSRFLL